MPAPPGDYAYRWSSGIFFTRIIEEGTFTIDPQEDADFLLTARVPVMALKHCRACGLRFCLWAQVDLNHRPHPYQGCALTELSYGPFRIGHPMTGLRAGRRPRSLRSSGRERQ